MVAKFLKIDTVLGKAARRDIQDQLLLISFDGLEHISKPFRYELIILRGKDPVPRPPGDPSTRPVQPSFTTKQEIDPRQLLGTTATVGLLGKGDDEYVLRTGVFSEFHRLGFEPDHNFLVYFAVLIPAFEFLGMETRYRIFENKTALEVIRDVLSDMRSRFPDFKFDLSSLQNSQFPKEFYVQYGESTFGFLNRVMARHGIFYFFGQDPTNLDAPGVPINDVLVLGRDRRARSGLPPDARFDNIDMEILNLKDVKSPRSPKIITNFRRIYTPGLRKVAVLDFNVLDPTAPIRGKDDIIQSYDVVGGGQQGGPGSFLQRTDALAAIALKTTGSPGQGEATPADDYAQALLQRPETAALRATGDCENSFFSAGALFRVRRDSTTSDDLLPPGARPDGLNEKLFILESVHLQATENSYKTTTEEDVTGVIDTLLKPIADGFAVIVDAFDFLFKLGRNVFRPESAVAQLRDAMNQFKELIKKNAGANDPIVSLASQGISNYLQNEASDRVIMALWPDKVRAHPDYVSQTDFAGYFFGGIFANAASLLPSLFNPLSAIAKVLLANEGKRSIAFVAIPFNGGAEFPLRPAAVGEKPIVYGPQFATVIGLKGKDPELGDIHADAFGRVRIRFPWDPGPPQGSPGATSDPFLNGLNTCWVRVSEGWAGEKFGTQFLPRVGQEVLVEFINGDPERPVITGRMYNANKGTANLPFPQKGLESFRPDNDYLLEPAFPSPGDQMRRSGIKTQITPRTDPIGFHLLRFDDDRDHKQVLIRSQGRLDITAFDKRFESIGSDRHLTVGGKKTTPPPPEIGGDYIAHVFRHYHLHVGDASFPDDSGNRFTRIEQNDEVAVVQDSLQDIGGNWSTNVGGQMTVNALKVEGTIVLNALANITLMVGTSMIVITPASITLQSPSINLAGPVYGAPVIGPPAPAVPAPPIPPFVTNPTDPTPADPGNTPTPPQQIPAKS